MIHYPVRIRNFFDHLIIIYYNYLLVKNIVIVNNTTLLNTIHIYYYYYYYKILIVLIFIILQFLVYTWQSKATNLSFSIVRIFPVLSKKSTLESNTFLYSVYCKTNI